MRYILLFCIKMLPFLAAAGVGAALFRRRKRRRLKKQNESVYFGRDVAVVVFAMIVAGIISQTLLPEMRLNGNGIEFVFADYGDINLEPFRVFRLVRADYRNGHNYSLWINLLGNIGLFVPVGFLASLLTGKTVKGILFTFFFSLFIETAQYFVGRSTDIDDLMLNTLGGIIGALIFLLVRKKRFVEKIRESK